MVDTPYKRGDVIAKPSEIVVTPYLIAAYRKLIIKHGGTVEEGDGYYGDEKLYSYDVPQFLWKYLPEITIEQRLDGQ